MLDFFNNDIHKIVDNEVVIPFSNGVQLVVRREDLIHPEVSGNKFRKLKYNIAKAISQGETTLVTFGGAHSNHIAATAAAGAILGLKTIGVIRGEELVDVSKHSPTLQFASSKGMIFHFVSREVYKEKETEAFVTSLKQKLGSFYLIAEGGTNALAVKGCTEILTEEDADYDFICCSVGTGGTIAGLVQASKPHQQVIGFSALKGTFQIEAIKKYTSKNNVTITDAYCFDGYAKTDEVLIGFMNMFLKQTGILLDPVYTAKMMFGIYEMIEKETFPKNSRILAIHTGGLQGIKGMNKILDKKNRLLIDTE